MIIVTEQHLLEGTGDIQKDIEYPKFDSYRLNEGNLFLYRANADPDKPAIEEAYYPKGTFVKVRRS